jgi:polyphosphate kinase
MPSRRRPAPTTPARSSAPAVDRGVANETARARRPKRPQPVPVLPAADWGSVAPTDLHNPALYINRELSWLEFNQRVLMQARDAYHPLLERVKFVAIVGTNLDEFFMVRVATLLKKYRARMEDVAPDGLNTEQQLRGIIQRAKAMLDEQAGCWDGELRPMLASEGITFLEPSDWTPAVSAWLSRYFKSDIFPALTPLAFDPGHPFPYISNLSMNFAVVVRHGGRTKFARVKVPDMLPRFVQLPAHLSASADGPSYVFLEDVIRANIHELFPGTRVEGAFLFRIIRDTDIVIQEDEADDLLESVDRSLKQLRYGALSLLQVDEQMPQRVLSILVENFEVDDNVVLRTPYRMGFSDWWELTSIHRPRLKDPVFSPRPLWNGSEDIFEEMRYEDHLVHHPFEAFTSVEQFLRQAVKDPQVAAIKMTLYRIGQNSPLIDLLIEAAEEGKQVAVLVELKARFDERNNIIWANRLEEAGVHVVYGLVNLKTHCKLCLVVRKEPDGIRRYAHVGTGNYNAITSKVYTDIGLFTANPAIIDDVSEVFNYLTGYSGKKQYQELFVAPVSLRLQVKALIEREAEHARAGRPARIIVKNNAVADPSMVRHFYRASQAGVPIEMIVRGVCCLRPGIPGISERIRVRSIVGRFLEHSRIYYFLNGGDEEIYIGSADLMERNLDRRVETLCPVHDPDLRLHLRDVVLKALLDDTHRSMELRSDGSYERVSPPPGQPPLNAQQFLLDHYTSQRPEE